MTMTSTTHSSHPLDNVIWSALTSRHNSLAIGDDLARRYPAEIAPFGAMAEVSATGFEALTRLTALDDRVALFTLEGVTPPSHFAIERKKSIDQMVGAATRRTVDTASMVRLGADDVPEMMALVELAQPGPFAAKTYRLGTYLGIRVDGRLAAMAGERMRLDGFTEISAVCTHPDFRGRGYPSELIGALSNAILDRGEQPFLHVFDDNLAASALYRKLGFTLREVIELTVLHRAVA
jgi:predicted GNAT family acetyltransferase